MDIFKAAETGNLACVKQCLSEGRDINAVNSEGRTALFIASWYNNVNVVQYLLEKNADTEVREKENQWTALITAARNNCRDVVKVLLQHGSDVNVQGKVGETPLWLAAYRGHQDTVQILLDHKACVDSRMYDHQTTPLYVASQQGHVEVVEMLIRAGASLESREKSYGVTSLIMAAIRNQSAVVDVLCQAGADVNSRDNYGRTALHWAAEKNAIETVRTLLKYLLALSQNKGGKTALDIAKEKGHQDIITAIEKYVKEQQDQPTTGVVPRSQPGAEKCIQIAKDGMKASKNQINELRGVGIEYNKLVKDMGRELTKLVAGVKEVQQSQTEPVQSGATADVKEDPWRPIGQISKEKDELPGLEDHPKDLGNKHLFRIAKRLGAKWKQLGVYLERSHEEIQSIQKDNPNDEVYCACVTLMNWRDATSEPVDKKKRLLIRAVKEVDITDVVPYI